jgi:hypothetical protein
MSEISKKTGFEEIIGLIKHKTNLSEEEILDRINKKLGQNSGLIPREVAAHMVATEFGLFFSELKGLSQNIKRPKENKLKRNKKNKRKKKQKKPRHIQNSRS